MTYGGLYLFVEGNDDERLFKSVFANKLEEKYGWVKLYKYSNSNKEKVNNFLKVLKANGIDYIFTTDINDSPCITARKDTIKSRYKEVDYDKIIVIVKEIESWYLAGLDENACKELKIKNFSTTDDITKEQFNNLIPKKFSSRIDFMREILNRFSVEVAKTKNKSFRYFANKYQI